MQVSRKTPEGPLEGGGWPVLSHTLFLCQQRAGWPAGNARLSGRSKAKPIGGGSCMRTGNPGFHREASWEVPWRLEANGGFCRSAACPHASRLLFRRLLQVPRSRPVENSGVLPGGIQGLKTSDGVLQIGSPSTRQPAQLCLCCSIHAWPFLHPSPPAECGRWQRQSNSGCPSSWTPLAGRRTRQASLTPTRYRQSEQ